MIVKLRLYQQIGGYAGQKSSPAQKKRQSPTFTRLCQTRYAADFASKLESVKVDITTVTSFHQVLLHVSVTNGEDHFMRKWSSFYCRGKWLHQAQGHALTQFYL